LPDFGDNRHTRWRCRLDQDHRSVYQPPEMLLCQRREWPDRPGRWLTYPCPWELLLLIDLRLKSSAKSAARERWQRGERLLPLDLFPCLFLLTGKRHYRRCKPAHSPVGDGSLKVCKKVCYPWVVG